MDLYLNGLLWTRSLWIGSCMLLASLLIFIIVVPGPHWMCISFGQPSGISVTKTIAMSSHFLFIQSHIPSNIYTMMTNQLSGTCKRLKNYCNHLRQVEKDEYSWYIISQFIALLPVWPCKRKCKKYIYRRRTFKKPG